MLACIIFLDACGNTSQTPKVSEIENTESMTESTSQDPVKITIQPVGTNGCVSVLSSDDGCSCSFRLEKDNWKQLGFISTLANKSVGCLSLNGSPVEVSGGRIDNRAELYGQSHNTNWITLNQKGPVLFFDKLVDLGNYQQSKEILIQTLLVMDEMPTEIPIKNNSQGMAIREVRDLASDALAEAKQRRAKGDKGIKMQMKYTNEQYDVIITGEVDGQNDSGGDTYEATLEVKSKDGAVLDSKKVWGDCNC
jgi:hypothetical protein